MGAAAAEPKELITTELCSGSAFKKGADGGHQSARQSRRWRWGECIELSVAVFLYVPCDPRGMQHTANVARVLMLLLQTESNDEREANENTFVCPRRSGGAPFGDHVTVFDHLLSRRSRE